MKKIFAFLILAAFMFPGEAKADQVFMGAQVEGSCCYSTGPVASAMDMSLLYAGIVSQHTAWTEKVVEAIVSGTKSVQSSSAQTAGAALNVQAQNQALTLGAQSRIDSANRNIFDTPVSDCQNTNFGYYFTMGGELEQKAIGYAVAAQRDVAAGLTEDMNKRDLMLGALAKFFDKHGFLFPGPVYTSGQQRAANDAFDLLLPEWKNPRPKNLKEGGVEEARYRIAEARVRILRSMLAYAWYDFTMERSATIPAKELYAAIGENHNAFTMMDYETIVDEKTGLMKTNAKPVEITVGPDDKISRRALYEIPFMYFTNDDFLRELGGKGAAAVLKEDFRLHIYEYRLLNDMRKLLQMSNLLKSVSLLPYYGELVSLPDTQISR